MFLVNTWSYRTDNDVICNFFNIPEFIAKKKGDVALGDI
ncbi:MAG: hypothetical protein ACD_75C01197G0002, partial [uncultured bacterium]